MLKKLGRGLTAGNLTSRNETGTGFLDDVISSVCCDLDATISGSYTSGQTWANLIESPNDGEAQTAYDFYLGPDASATSQDPVFTGTVGDPAAYFALDGTQAFSLTSGSNTTFLAELNKSAAATGDYWIAMVVRTPNSSIMDYYGNGGAGTGKHGVSAEKSSTEFFTFTQRGGANNYLNTDIKDASDHYQLILVSFDKSANTMKVMLDGALDVQSFTYLSSAVNAQYSFVIGGAGYTGTVFVKPLKSGSRVVSFAMGNSYLTDSEVQSLVSHIETRHGRFYGGYQAAVPTAPLSDVIASAVMDLDSSIAASYSGSGTAWSNLIASPADGELQSAYDFTASSTPDFFGSAGSTTYFRGNTSMKFDLNGANTTFLNNLHKTTGGNDWWAAFTMYNYEGTGGEMLFSENGNAIEGVETMLLNGAGTSFRTNFDRAGLRQNNNVTNPASVANNTHYLVIISWDASTDTIKMWVNSTTAVMSRDAHSLTSTTNPTGKLTIGSRPPAATVPRLITEDTYLSSFAMGNEYLDDTKAAVIFNHLETRHNRTYI